MGFLDSIKEMLTGKGQSDQAVQIISQLIAESGGLEGFVDRFEVAGHGDKIESWLSPGPNLPITPDQIKNIIGLSHLESLASRFGIEPYQLTNQLSKHLPKMIDRLTPDGYIPSIEQYKLKMDQWRHLFH